MAGAYLAQTPWTRLRLAAVRDLVRAPSGRPRPRSRVRGRRRDAFPLDIRVRLVGVDAEPGPSRPRGRSSPACASSSLTSCSCRSRRARSTRRSRPTSSSTSTMASSRRCSRGRPSARPRRHALGLHAECRHPIERLKDHDLRPRPERDARRASGCESLRVASRVAGFVLDRDEWRPSFFPVLRQLERAAGERVAALRYRLCLRAARRRRPSRSRPRDAATIATAALASAAEWRTRRASALRVGGDTSAPKVRLRPESQRARCPLAADRASSRTLGLARSAAGADLSASRTVPRARRRPQPRRCLRGRAGPVCGRPGALRRARARRGSGDDGCSATGVSAARRARPRRSRRTPAKRSRSATADDASSSAGSAPAGSAGAGGTSARGADGGRRGHGRSGASTPMAGQERGRVDVAVRIGRDAHAEVDVRQRHARRAAPADRPDRRLLGVAPRATAAAPRCSNVTANPFAGRDRHRAPAARNASREGDHAGRGCTDRRAGRPPTSMPRWWPAAYGSSAEGEGLQHRPFRGPGPGGGGRSADQDRKESRKQGDQCSHVCLLISGECGRTSTVARACRRDGGRHDFRHGSVRNSLRNGPLFPRRALCGRLVQSAPVRIEYEAPRRRDEDPLPRPRRGTRDRLRRARPDSPLPLVARRRGRRARRDRRLPDVARGRRRLRRAHDRVPRQPPSPTGNAQIQSLATNPADGERDRRSETSSSASRTRSGSARSPTPGDLDPLDRGHERRGPMRPRRTRSCRSPSAAPGTASTTAQAANLLAAEVIQRGLGLRRREGRLPRGTAPAQNRELQRSTRESTDLQRGRDRRSHQR